MHQTRPSDGAMIELDDGRRIQAIASDGYGRVVDAFIRNFVERHDLGAACSVYVSGRLAVDVYGGWADARQHRPWERDTAAVMFSCSKGVLAICAYLLVQQERLDLDAPIAHYWPSFAEQGKAALSVRQALSHRAGLPCLDVDLTKRQVLAWQPVIRALEQQRPLFRPEDGHIYHALTYGWLIGEVIRRVTGLLPGEYLRHVLGDPLGLQTWIGLPDQTRASVAWTEPPLPDEDSDAARAMARVVTDNPIIARSTSMGGAFAFPAADGYVTFNDPEIQSAEIPGANGISTARSLSRLYAGCVSAIDGPPLLTPASIEDALRVQAAGPQLSGVADGGTRWGTGFQLSSPPGQPMLGPASFGHAGAGGQLAFGDAQHEVGFAYVTNQMGGFGDARARELTLAVRAAVGV